MSIFSKRHDDERVPSGMLLGLVFILGIAAGCALNALAASYFNAPPKAKAKPVLIVHQGERNA